MSGDSNLSVDIVRPHLKNTLHSNGHTFVDFEEGSATLITCNQSDNEVYIFKPHDIETGEPKCQSFGDDSSMNVSFLKVADDMAFVGLNNSTVQIYSYPQFEKEGLLVRFESTPLCVDLNHDKSFAAIGTADGTVRTVELSSPHRFKTFEGHLGPILSVCYDPSEDYLVTSSCDGTVKVWKCGDRKCIKTWDCVPKSNDVENSKVMAQCCWQPSCGTHLVVPGDKCVKFYDRRHQNFLESPKFTFTHYLIPDYVSMVCWHGKEVESSSAVSGKDENNLIAFIMENTNVLLVEFASNQCKVLRCIQGKQSKVTSFLWMPNSVDFVVADEIGMVYLYTNCVPVKAKRMAVANEAKNHSQSIANETVKGADDILNEMVKTHKEASGVDGNVNAADDDGDDGSISLDQIKHSYTLNMERGLEGEDADAEAGGDGQPRGSQSNNFNFYGSGGASNNQQTVVAAPKVEIISYQTPFQPSCSPVSLGTRYMKWNMIGIVRREEHSPTDDDAEDESSNASITVEFHDSTFHHSMHLNDDHGYTLADLSEEALLLASPSSIVNESKASVITCNTFSFWDHSNQWSTELPQGEKTVALCLGSQSWLAVATSFGLLRIFSVSGLQLSVIMLPGHLVSISGGTDELLHVYQPSQTLQRDRFYSAAVYKVTGFEVNLALNEQFPMCDADDSVIWTGFSHEGDAIVAFASGPMYMLKRSSSHNSGHCWLPVFNFKQFLNSKSDRIWTVGVTGKQLRAIYCKASKFPAQLPRPIVLTYNLGLPLCNIESEQSQMELELQNQRVFKALSTQEVQSAFLKMFALACRTDRDCRAVDICSLMPNEETVILAIKYATKLKKLTLAQKLSAIAHEKSASKRGDIDNGNRQQSFGGFEDENSRTLFGSQSVESGDTVQALDGGANLLSETDNPILRRANSGKIFKNVTIHDETTASDGSLLSPSASTMEVTDSSGKRRKNPFAHETSSSTSQLSTTASNMELGRSPSVGSSVFDNLKLIKPEKLKVGGDTAAKSLSRRKSVSSAAVCNKAEIGTSNQENTTPVMTAAGSESTVGAKKMTPFQIYFEKIKPGLRDEFAEKTDEDLLPVAMKRWKKLSADEKASESLMDGSYSGASLKRKSIGDIESSNTDSNIEGAGGCLVTKKKKFDSAILDQFSFN